LLSSNTKLPFFCAVLYHVAKSLKFMEQYTVTVSGVAVIVTPELVIRALFLFLYLSGWARSHLFSAASASPAKAKAVAQTAAADHTEKPSAEPSQAKSSDKKGSVASTLSKRTKQ